MVRCCLQRSYSYKAKCEALESDIADASSALHQWEVCACTAFFTPVPSRLLTWPRLVLVLVAMAVAIIWQARFAEVQVDHEKNCMQLLKEYEAKLSAVFVKHSWQRIGSAVAAQGRLQEAQAAHQDRLKKMAVEHGASSRAHEPTRQSAAHI